MDEKIDQRVKSMGGCAVFKGIVGEKSCFRQTTKIINVLEHLSEGLFTRRLNCGGNTETRCFEHFGRLGALLVLVVCALLSVSWVLSFNQIGIVRKDPT